jgi:hypothetical protein
MKPRINLSISLVATLTLSSLCYGFVFPRLALVVSRLEPLRIDRFNRDLEERSRRRAEGLGGGEAIAGAVLGTLVAGPFGLLFGSQIGASIGAKNALNKARKEEMERMGITQEMLDSAEQVGIALEQATEGLKATQTSLNTQRSLARRLERDTEELYEKAKAALATGNEDDARKFLFQKTECQEKLKRVLKLCIDEQQRYEKMQENVSAIEKRALEIEALLQRSVSAKTRQTTAFEELSLSVEDPLLQKFRDLGID